MPRERGPEDKPTDGFLTSVGSAIAFVHLQAIRHAEPALAAIENFMDLAFEILKRSAIVAAIAFVAAREGWIGESAAATLGSVAIGVWVMARLGRRVVKALSNEPTVWLWLRTFLVGYVTGALAHEGIATALTHLHLSGR